MKSDSEKQFWMNEYTTHLLFILYSMDAIIMPDALPMMKYTIRSDITHLAVREMDW
jgi:hypothetical protein